jgi:hypothetical protein
MVPYTLTLNEIFTLTKDGLRINIFEGKCVMYHLLLKAKILLKGSKKAISLYIYILDQL